MREKVTRLKDRTKFLFHWRKSKTGFIATLPFLPFRGSQCHRFVMRLKQLNHVVTLLSPAFGRDGCPACPVHIGVGAYDHRAEPSEPSSCTEARRLVSSSRRHF